MQRILRVANEAARCIRGRSALAFSAVDKGRHNHTKRRGSRCLVTVASSHAPREVPACAASTQSFTSASPALAHFMPHFTRPIDLGPRIERGDESRRPRTRGAVGGLLSGGGRPARAARCTRGARLAHAQAWLLGGHRAARDTSSLLAWRMPIQSRARCPWP